MSFIHMCVILSYMSFTNTCVIHSYVSIHSCVIHKLVTTIILFLSGNCLCLPPDMRLYDRVYCGASCPESHENYMKGLINVSLM